MNLGLITALAAYFWIACQRIELGGQHVDRSKTSGSP